MRRQPSHRRSRNDELPQEIRRRARRKVRLGKIDPGFKDKHDESHDSATPEIQKHVERMAKAQYLLYADGSQSLLVVLQALDAGGKDGVVRHVFTAMNPQGTLVV